MKVAVIGATGGVGAHAVKLALDKGWYVIAVSRDPTKATQYGTDKMDNVKVDLANPDAAEKLAAGIRGADFVVSCLGNRRGEPPIVAKGTAAVMSAMAQSRVPRMAMISSMGIGDSGAQLRRGGFGGWVYTCLFATVLRHVKNDLSAAEALAIGDNHKRPAGVSCVVVRPAGLSYADGDGSYEVARADGTVGTSVAREDLARFMLTLAEDQTYDNSAVSVGGNAPRVYRKG